MRFWIRELAGWLLVLAGLYFCYVSLSIVTNYPSRFFDAIHPTVIGIFVFRGGIHLLKVAVAARICLAATERTDRPRAASASALTAGAADAEW
jgi:hypothetical protein